MRSAIGVPIVAPDMATILSFVETASPDFAGARASFSEEPHAASIANKGKHIKPRERIMRRLDSTPHNHPLRVHGGHHAQSNPPDDKLR